MEKKQKKERKLESIGNPQEVSECNDRRCPYHGGMSVRGRTFKGYVMKIVGERAVIEWERIIYATKYERYYKKKSKVHAHIPHCLKSQVNIGSYVKIIECRPLSKIIHFIVLEVVK